MLNKIIYLFLVGICGFANYGLAFTIINQTDASKVIEIQEAYRPAPKEPGELCAPQSLGYCCKKTTLSPYSSLDVTLKHNPSVLLVSIITEKKKGRKITTTKETTCYEHYDYLGQYVENFDDNWGLVIHKPIDLKNSDFLSDYWNRINQERGYGIKCLHPQLLTKFTSAEELPEEFFQVFYK